ncbi:MAG TPA: trigger factor [Bacteroidales bacterium]|nr:trigger factor [Bacteroidales bacterium]
MNVDKQVIDSVNAVVKIQLMKADYKEKVENTLKNYRKKANVPGFRPGMVPAGLIQKMYGKSVLAEAVQDAVSEALYNYIRDNKLNILGEPLPSESQPMVDFDSQEDFEFAFDIALSPELDFTLNKKDSIPYYSITVTVEMVAEQAKNLAARNGSYVKAESSEEGDVLKGLLIEVQPDGTIGLEGISVEDAVLMPKYFKNDEEKAKLIGLGVGDTVVFNPGIAYDHAETELASLLKLPKEVASTVSTDFTFEVKEITRYEEGEMNQVLFDQLYGEGVVNSEEEFKAKIKEQLEAQFAPESDFRFMVDAEKILLKKAADLVFPVEFLKRWMLETQKRTEDKIDEEMPKMIEDLKWHLMKEKIVTDNNLTVSEEELLETAKKITRAQFAQYGMMNVPEDLLNGYAADMLKKEDSKRNIIDQSMSAAVAGFLKNTVKVNEKKISVEDFNKLFE